MEDGQRDGSILLFLATLPPGESMGEGPGKLLVAQSRVGMEAAHHSKAVPGSFEAISTWQYLDPHLGGGSPRLSILLLFTAAKLVPSTPRNTTEGSRKKK